MCIRTIPTSCGSSTMLRTERATTLTEILLVIEELREAGLIIN